MTIHKITKDTWEDKSRINIGNPYEVYRDQKEITRFQVDFLDKALGAVTYKLHPDKTDFNILELFCGNGGKARYIASVLNELYTINGKKVRFHVHGIDVVGELLEENDRRNKLYGYDGEMYVANIDNQKDIEELTGLIPPHSIDMVVSIKGFYNTFAKLDRSKVSFLAGIQPPAGIFYLEQYQVRGFLPNLGLIVAGIKNKKYGNCHFFDVSKSDALLAKWGKYKRVYQSKAVGFDDIFFNHFLIGNYTYSKIYVKK